MNLIGTVQLSGYEYFIQMIDRKGDQVLYLFTPYHDSDAVAYQMNDALQYPLLSSEFMINKTLDDGYVLEGLRRLKTSGKVFVYKRCDLIENILSNISFANNYTFAPTDITQKDDVFYLNENIYTFRAADQNLSFDYETRNGLYSRIVITYGDFRLNLQTAKNSYKYNSKMFEEISGVIKKNVLVNTIKVIDYQMLCDSLDMSWYRKDGVNKKDYKTIKTIREFELEVITPIMLAAQQHTVDNPLDLTLDTETTGLNIYDLSKDNPDKDHCVAVPMSWKPDTGVVIFTMI